MSESEIGESGYSPEPVQLTQIRQWEAGELYPEHDTFTFGHGFGFALVDAFDRARIAAEVDAALIRDVLEAMATKNGLSLASEVDPDKPARNYELALRLGIGEVFGLRASGGRP